MLLSCVATVESRVDCDDPLHPVDANVGIVSCVHVKSGCCAGVDPSWDWVDFLKGHSVLSTDGRINCDSWEELGESWV